MGKIVSDNKNYIKYACKNTHNLLFKSIQCNPPSKKSSVISRIKRHSVYKKPLKSLSITTACKQNKL